MKILVVSHSYVPNIDPRALRWTALSEEWARLGHQVHVICGYLPEQGSEGIRNGVRFHRVGAGWLDALRQLARRQSAPGAAGMSDAMGTGGRSWQRAVLDGLRQALKRVHDLTWKKLYWPDSTCLWIGPASRYGRRLARRERFDLLVSVSHPFSGHVVGLMIRRTEPNLRWVMDSGDPFCFLKESPVNNARLYGKLNRWIEKCVFKQADVSVVTTEGTAEIYRALFPAHGTKVVVIHPLLRTGELPQPSTARNSGDPGAVRAVYVGAWYKGIREPSWVLSAFEDLVRARPDMIGKIQLHFFGPGDDVQKALPRHPSIADVVRLHGLVSPQRAVHEIFGADLLINVGNKTEYQLPSKIVEYIASGRPILNLCSTANDSSANLLRLVGHPYRNMNVKGAPSRGEAGEEGGVAEIAEFVMGSRGIVLDVDRLRTITDRFSVQTLAREYMDAAFARGTGAGLSPLPGSLG